MYPKVRQTYQYIILYVSCCLPGKVLQDIAHTACSPTFDSALASVATLLLYLGGVNRRNQVGYYCTVLSSTVEVNKAPHPRLHTSSVGH